MAAVPCLTLKQIATKSCQENTSTAENINSYNGKLVWQEAFADGKIAVAYHQLQEKRRLQIKSSNHHVIDRLDEIYYG